MWLCDDGKQLGDPLKVRATAGAIRTLRDVVSKSLPPVVIVEKGQMTEGVAFRNFATGDVGNDDFVLTEDCDIVL